MTFDPFLTPPAFEDDDWVHWRRYGQVPDTEDDYAREREEFEDRMLDKAPAGAWR